MIGMACLENQHLQICIEIQFAVTKIHNSQPATTPDIDLSRQGKRNIKEQQSSKFFFLFPHNLILSKIKKIKLKYIFVLKMISFSKRYFKCLFNEGQLNYVMTSKIHLVEINLKQVLKYLLKKKLSYLIMSQLSLRLKTWKNRFSK